MGKTYIKTIIREIRGSLGRFFAIFSIVALGLGFLAGLSASTPNMKASVDLYYEENNMADIFIKSNLGLTEDDLKVVSKVAEVESIMPAYVTDELIETDKRELFTSRIYGLPLSSANSNHQFINRLTLEKGRMPRANNECLVQASRGYISGLELGTTLTIIKEDEDDEDELEDTYKNTEFTVVGVVSNPFYFSTEREPSSVGDGRLGAIIYVDEDNYDLDVYTDFYIRALGSGDLPSFTDPYEDYTDAIVRKIEKIGKKQAKIRHAEVLADANELLNNAKDDYDAGKAKAYKSLEDASRDLQVGQAELIAAQAELSLAKDEITSNELSLQSERAAFESEIRAQEAVFEQAQIDLNQARQSLISAQALIGMEAYNTGILDIIAQETKLLEGKNQLSTKKSEAIAKFQEAQAQLDQAKLGVNDGEADLRAAKEDLAKGQADYARAKDQVEQELADADFKITEAEEYIEDIKDGKWYVLDRKSNVSYASFSANVEKVGAIAKVFPVFFLLVAALVALTTMTRMVEEGRTQIGTLKALGYTNSVIMSKYIIYCGIASLLGSMLGLTLGFEILPKVIWSAYKTMYHLPPLTTSFDWNFAIISSAVAIASTLGATISAANTALTEKPATLMVPRAPKAGKRIFLERVTFVWSRMKFTHKATARNLIRYKKHFFMTVIGISGCTALIVAGFGLKDSLGDIANTQFQEILTYDLIVETDDTNKGDKVLENFLSNPNKVKDHMRLFSDQGKVLLDGESFAASIRVPEESTKLKKFINLRQRQDHEPTTFNDSSVLVTEKLAETLGIKKGDTFILENGDDQKAEFVLTGITENYVGSYAYINKGAYAKAFGEDFSYDTLLIKTLIQDADEQDTALNEVLSGETTLSAEFMSQAKASYDSLLESINFIVIVLILAAGGLAIIVLYNLTNINIEERRKELATLKVLGFHNKEVAAYIYRETTILSVIGTGVGLLLGTLLHGFIVQVGESVDLMFGRDISPLSFVLSAVITLMFSGIVDIIMYKKLKNIEMVDSMKAID